MGTLVVGEEDRAGSPDDGGAGAGGAVNAGDVRRPINVADIPREHRFGPAKYEAGADAADPQWILPAVEEQHAVAPGAADEPAPLVFRDPNLAAVRMGGGRG